MAHTLAHALAHGLYITHARISPESIDSGDQNLLALGVVLGGRYRRKGRSQNIKILGSKSYDLAPGAAPRVGIYLALFTRAIRPELAIYWLRATIELLSGYYRAPQVTVERQGRFRYFSGARGSLPLDLEPLEPVFDLPTQLYYIEYLLPVYIGLI